MKIYIATGNAHKVEELQKMFADSSELEVEVYSAKAVGGMPNVVEDADTFEGNAWLKAEALWKLIDDDDALVLADDSGIAVDALGGAPGIYSARYAGLDGPEADPANNQKLLKALETVPWEKRTGRFVCCLVLLGKSVREAFEDVCEGRVGFEEHGAHGFGYDPLFFPLGYEVTTAQMPAEEKNKISHRAKALQRLVAYLSAR